MTTLALRTIEGLTFECPSPSVWHLKDEPVTLAFDGQQWRLSFIGRNNIRREGCYVRRDLAIALLKEAYFTKQKQET